jgi:hypothetical protein
MHHAAAVGTLQSRMLRVVKSAGGFAQLVTAMQGGRTLCEGKFGTEAEN